MKMCIVTAHAGSTSLAKAVNSWRGTSLFVGNPDIPDVSGLFEDPETYIVNGSNGMLPAYQRGFKHAVRSGADVIAFLHDDTIINDPNWTERVLKEFENPKVGLVGFGGATGHGQPGLYRDPYDYKQLARSNFLSNMVDAENHGKRFTGSCDVAVLDGFALIVRRDVLEKSGGWPLETPIGYACYDYWLSCMTRRLGYMIRVVGVPCQHLGGQTFVKLGIGKDPKHWQQYIDSHRYIYEEFPDALPYEVPQ